MDIINFIWVTALFAVIMYFIANFMIQNSTMLLQDVTETTETEGSSESAASGESKVAEASQAVNIINLLGGRGNIVDVDACMTRLRYCKDAEKVGTEEQWKAGRSYGTCHERTRCPSYLRT